MEIDWTMVKYCSRQEAAIQNEFPFPDVICIPGIREWLDKAGIPYREVEWTTYKGELTCPSPIEPKSLYWAMNKLRKGT